jgi:hypothetical protein
VLALVRARSNARCLRRALRRRIQLANPLVISLASVFGESCLHP